MIIPEALWLPSEKDLKAQFSPDRVLRRSSQTAAAAVITDNILAVPTDHVAFVTNIVVQARAGGAQTCTFQRIAVVDQSGNTLSTIASRAEPNHMGAAAANEDLNWSGLVVVMPGEIVLLEADFSAGVAANTLGGGLFGVLVPRGNWHFG